VIDIHSLTRDTRKQGVWRPLVNHQGYDDFAYETLLKEEIFVGILNRNIRGLESIQLLRREVEEEVEFGMYLLRWGVNNFLDGSV